MVNAGPGFVTVLKKVVMQGQNKPLRLPRDRFPPSRGGRGGRSVATDMQKQRDPSLALPYREGTDWWTEQTTSSAP